ncbi:MAG: hypothetical protein HYS34_03120 [Acidobacteria bacterium]|nr:hypothetical protein [Acidobacteriota bacterium]
MILRYAALVLLIAAAGSAAAALWRGGLEGPVARGVILGAALASFGAIGGMGLLAWSFGRGQTQFFGALVLGILGRLLVFGGVLVYVALRAPAFDRIASAVSLLGFYLVFQVLELWFVLKGLAGRRSGA